MALLPRSARRRFWVLVRVLEVSRFPVAVFLLLGALTHLVLPWSYQLRLPFWIPHSREVVLTLSIAQGILAFFLLNRRTARIAAFALFIVLAVKLIPVFDPKSPEIWELRAPRIALHVGLLIWCAAYWRARSHPTKHLKTVG